MQSNDTAITLAYQIIINEPAKDLPITYKIYITLLIQENGNKTHRKHEYKEIRKAFLA